MSRKFKKQKNSFPKTAFFINPYGQVISYKFRVISYFVGATRYSCEQFWGGLGGYFGELGES